MISIIVSSYNSILFSNFSQNVSETIGVPYEIVKIENPGLYSLTEAYNLGIDRSNYEYLCFCHEDIKFHTQNWGIALQNIFSKEEIGVLGVTGTKNFGSLPIGWWSFGWKDNISYLIDSHKGNKSKLYNKNFSNISNLENVLVVDGLFLASQKISGLRFNEDFKGFHAYDISFCMESLKVGRKNFVTNTILIEHFSGGNLNNEWLRALDFFINYYYNEIQLIEKYDKSIAYDELKRVILKAYDFKNINFCNKYWRKLAVRYPFSKFHVVFLMRRLGLY